MTKSLMTLKAVKAAIRKAPAVFVTPKFGVSEVWVPVSKAAALKFLAAAVPEGASPGEIEMYGGEFGSVSESGSVFLG